MKTSSLFAICFASLTLINQASQEPTGSLSVNKPVIRQGGVPQLSWNISHPVTAIEEIVDIDKDTDLIVAKKKLRVQISVIGIGITDGRNEYKSESKIYFSSTDRWHRIYRGYGSRVNTSTVHIDRIIERGETIKFKARYYNRVWRPYFTSDSSNVKALVNGDRPPSKDVSYHDQTSLSDYLRPYVKDGLLSLGDLDVIYAAELTHTNPDSSGYDMQDTIVLLRFSEVE